MRDLSYYLDPKLVAFIDAETRDEVLEQLVALAAEKGKVMDNRTFYKAIIEREKIVSTGIGMSVAIPHAKLAHYDDFFIVIGILKNGVDWGAMDGSSVRLVVMIGGPDDKQTEYLQILSTITLALKDEELRKKILTLGSPEAIIEAFRRGCGSKD